MPLPNSIREEFINAMRPYADSDIPDSVRMTAWEAAERILDISKKVGLIDRLPGVGAIRYENGILSVTIDEEVIEIRGKE